MNTQMTKPSFNTGNFALQTLEDIEKYSVKFANSSLCPTALKGRPGDVFSLAMTGYEMGLTFHQSMRVLGVFNGYAFAYGDGLAGLAQCNRDWDGMETWMEGEIDKRTLTAFCTVKRKGVTPITKHYSMADAAKANLLNKQNWVNVQRMLQRRAQSFALKDQFADSIMGLYTEDEIYDIPREVSIPTPVSKGLQGLRESVGLVNDNVIEQEVIIATQEIDEVETTNSLDKLQEMITRLEVPQKTIDAWLKKAKVESVEDFSEAQIQKCIAHLKTKEEKDAIHTAYGTGIESAEASGAWTV